MERWREGRERGRAEGQLIAVKEAVTRVQLRPAAQFVSDARAELIAEGNVARRVEADSGHRGAGDVEEGGVQAIELGLIEADAGADVGLPAPVADADIV